VLLVEKRVTPMQKMVQFMKDREYRTSDFFRILDKGASRSMTHEELADRLLVCRLSYIGSPLMWVSRSL